MKYILYSLLFIAFSAKSQHDNFSINRGLVTWSQTFESNLSIAEINTKLKEYPLTSEISIETPGYTEPTVKNCEGKLTAIYLRDVFYGYAKIKKTKTGFDVTVSNIKFKPSRTLTVGYEQTTGVDIQIEYYVMKKNQIKSNRQTQRNLECIHQTFYKMFEL